MRPHKPIEVLQQKVVVPQRPVLTEAMAARYAPAVVLDGWYKTSKLTGAAHDYIVGASGQDNPPHRFRQIQDAINQAVSDGLHRRVIIAVEEGSYSGPVYIPKSAPPITLIGLGSPEKVVISAAIDAQMPGSEFKRQFGTGLLGALEYVRAIIEKISEQEIVGTDHSSVLRIEANDFKLVSLTVCNSYACNRTVKLIDQMGNDGRKQSIHGQHQAVAVMVAGADRVTFDRVHLSSFQDTLYLKAANPVQPNQVHLRHCDIEGDVDFIFGQSIALFEHCTIRSKGVRKTQSWAVAPSTNIRSPYGFVFRQCRFTHDNSPSAQRGEMLLGRQWFEGVRATPYGHSSIGNYSVSLGETSSFDAPQGVISKATLESVGKCVLIDCVVGKHINVAAPWGDWNGGAYCRKGIWSSAPWHLRYRPVQTCVADFKRELEAWMLKCNVSYQDVDPDECWLGEYGTTTE